MDLSEKSFFSSILSVLQKMGGKGKVSEVIDRVINLRGITEDHYLEKGTASIQGREWLERMIRGARQRLLRAAFLRESEYGYWELAHKGMKFDCGADGGESVLDEDVRKSRRMPDDPGINLPTDEALFTGDQVALDNVQDHRQKLLDKLRGLEPNQFEQICKRLLTEIGFEGVVVTGGPNDGGIDGHGWLAINPVVKMRVAFQCKRYAEGNTVGKAAVRNFRGGIPTNIEKAIMITTSSFTLGANQEATREGIIPVEIIDGDRLVDLFVEYRLGVKEISSFEIDEKFFAQFESAKNEDGASG